MVLTIRWALQGIDAKIKIAMRSFERNIVQYLFFVLALTVSTFASADEFEAYKKSCLSPSGGSYIVELENGIKWKPDAEELKAKLVTLDRKTYCDCIFKEFENTFGKVQYVEFRNPNKKQLNPTKLIADAAQAEQIQYSCFGRQIGRRDLGPPSKKDVVNLLKATPPPAHLLLMQNRKAKISVNQIRSLVDLYKSDNGGKLPASLNALTAAPMSYLKPAQLKDPWGNDFIVESVPSGFRIVSPGPDGKIKTSDDVLSD